MRFSSCRRRFTELISLSLPTERKLKSAKRTAFIEKDEKFFNAHQILERYRKNVIEVFEKVKNIHPDVEMVVIYGGIVRRWLQTQRSEACTRCGKSCRKVLNMLRTNEFYAFDIKLNGTTYLDTDVVNEIFEETDFSMQKFFFRELWKML